MAFRISLGEASAKLHPDCDLHIGTHLTFHDDLLKGEILDDPGDATLRSRLSQIQHSDIEIITSLQGRYGLSVIGKIVNYLRERGHRVSISVEPIPEQIRQFCRAPIVKLRSAMDTTIPSARAIRVFLCHASVDKPRVRDLYRRLVAMGVDTWLDEEKLLPGQDWRAEIEHAMRSSDLVLVCLTRRAVDRAGFVQKEVKYALDLADEQPDGSIYVVPVKLESCDVPTRLQRWQWLDLVSETAYTKLAQMLVARADELRRREQGGA